MQRDVRDGLTKEQLGAVLKDLMGKFRVHDLRHTAARRTLRKTKNLRAVQRVLGHSDVTTTAIYADVMHDDIRAAIEETEAAYNPRKIPGDDVNASRETHVFERKKTG